MPILYNRLRRRDTTIFVVLLLSMAIINLSAPLFRMIQEVFAGVSYTPWWILALALVVQGPYIHDVLLVMQGKTTSAFGLYLVIVSMNLLLVIALGSLPILLLGGLMGFYLVIFFAIGGVIAETLSGFGLPLLIRLQPLILWFLTPKLPAFIHRTTNQVSISSSRKGTRKKLSSLIIPWVHPDLYDPLHAFVFVVATIGYSLVSGFFYFLIPSFFIPMNSPLWDSWIF